MESSDTLDTTEETSEDIPTTSKTIKGIHEDIPDTNITIHVKCTRCPMAYDKFIHLL